MKERTLTICLATIVLAVFVFLSYRETGLQNGPSRNGWWSVGFEDPKGRDLGFALTNEGPDGIFDWKVLVDGQIVSEGRENLGSGQEKSVRPDIGTDGISGKIAIDIYSGQDMKELYKLFP